MLTIDRRELQQHREIKTLITIPHTIKTLEAGDFAFLDWDNQPVGIERAEITDLIGKLRSGRLEEQMTRCARDYNTVVLLVEGVYDNVDGLLAIYRKRGKHYYMRGVFSGVRYTYVAATLIRLAEMGIEVIHSANFEDSMTLVQALYNQRTTPPANHSLFKRIRPVNIPVKLSDNPAVPKLLALCPRMPEKVAIRLLDKYGSIWNILSTPNKELLGVEGMGKGLLEKLHTGVGK